MDPQVIVYGFSRIKISDIVLGSGVFATVHLGELKIDENIKIRVAVKISNIEKCRLASVNAEIGIMKQLNHENVCRMIGTSRLRFDTLPSILLEYMDGGSLSSYMKNNKALCDFVFKAKVTKMVAAGMKYLNVDLGICHGDLHSQNCLIHGTGENLIIKVADFGYSVQNVQKEQDIMAGPIGLYGRPKGDVRISKASRWKAPECVPGLIYRSVRIRPGDVWAYANLLFEVWNDGAIPFHKLNDDVVCHLVARGYNPLDFRICRAPKRIVNIMVRCFQLAPVLRPIFTGILEVLTKRSKLGSAVLELDIEDKQKNEENKSSRSL